MENEKKGIFIASGIFIVIAVGVLWFNRSKTVKTQSPTSVSTSSSTQLPTSAPASEASNIALPPLESSDAFFREHAATISTDPKFARWLKSDDLIARVVSAAHLVTSGKVPSDVLSFLAPRKKFAVKKKGADYVMTPAGFARYNEVGNFVSSIDAKQTAQLAKQLKPLFQAAWRGLGEKDFDIFSVFERAGHEILSAPIAQSELHLKERDKGIGYAYVDDAIEALSPVQKQLIRMGPANQEKVQTKVREIFSEMGLK